MPVNQTGLRRVWILILIMNQEFLAQKSPLILSGLFAGAAAYVAFISPKGRKRLEPKDQLVAWADEFRPALSAMGGLAALTTAAGLYAYYVTKNPKFAIGSGVMGLCFPYTYFLLTPLYTKLLKADVENSSSEETTAVTDTWVQRHKGRVLISIVASLIFLFAEATGSKKA